jgi:hypothetical protein
MPDSDPSLEWERLTDEGICGLSRASYNHAALTASEQELASLWRLQADVCNGGFIQFFCNWGIETHQIALLALEKIGAAEILGILQRQYATIERFEDDPRLTTLWDLPALLTEDEAQQLQKGDEAFWSCIESIVPLGLAHYKPLMEPPCPAT